VTPDEAQVTDWEIDELSGTVFMIVRHDSNGDRKFTSEDTMAVLKVSALEPDMGVDVVNAEIGAQLRALLGS
jgi:hypothetical protein